MPEKTNLELLIRRIVAMIQSAEGKPIFHIITAIGPVIALVPKLADELSGKSRAELAVMFRDTLDNLVGDEDDALIGEKGSLVSGDVPFISNEMLESLSDIVFTFVANQWAADVNPTDNG